MEIHLGDMCGVGEESLKGWLIGLGFGDDAGSRIENPR
jgi:hypothetical protein